MNSNFRITYKPRFKHQDKCTSEYIAGIFRAPSVDHAIAQIGDYWTIRSITVQCAGVTKSGHACQRFTNDEYCCEAHARSGQE